MNDWTKFVIEKEKVPLFFNGEFLELEKKYKIQKTAKKNNERIKKINVKNERDEIIQSILINLEDIIKTLLYIDRQYKKLYHKTEFWENKSTLDFRMWEWKTIKKVNGRLAKYINDLLEVKRRLKNENN